MHNHFLTILALTSRPGSLFWPVFFIKCSFKLNINTWYHALVKPLPPLPCHNTHTLLNLITQCPVSYCLILQWPHHRHWKCNLFSSPTGEQMALYKELIKKKHLHHTLKKIRNFINIFAIFTEQMYNVCAVQAKYTFFKATAQALIRNFRTPSFLPQGVNTAVHR